MARIATCLLIASTLAGGWARADDCVASVRGIELSAAWQSAVDGVRQMLANRSEPSRATTGSGDDVCGCAHRDPPRNRCPFNDVTTISTLSLIS